MNNKEEVPGSFRDPSGFLFWHDGSLHRQINISYKRHYDCFMSSGLYESLTNTGLLIPHQEATVEPAQPQVAYKIIQPERIDFISYPYEWCFSQLKDAALTTLRIQREALDFGLSLKDASAYNIQFQKGKPVFIDTLSFEIYKEGQPWVAYRQFCQHFLAPLALMSYRDIRLNQLLRIYIDGIPLDLASALQPLRTRFHLSLFSHVHLHSRSQKRFAEKALDTSQVKMSHIGLLGLIDNLESTIQHLNWQPQDTEWANYYQETNYSANALDHKRQIVDEFLNQIRPRSLWDLGANTGVFSRIASNKGIPTISFDNDPAAVEMNYLECRKNGEINTLPLVVDLTNPSPSLGWQNRERMSLTERGPADTVLALALVHHLAISNNVPLSRLAFYFNSICDSLIIEFVPKTDSQVQRLLVSRDDIFTDYNQQTFEFEFGRFFNIENSVKIKDSERTIYLMRKMNR